VKTYSRIFVSIRKLGAIRSNRKFLIGLCIIVGIFVISGIGSAISPYHPRRIGDVAPNLPPSSEHILGTDPMGRDILTQLFAGTLLSMQIGFTAGIIAFAVALLLAMLGAYYGGYGDSIINVFTEVFITIPSLAILILIAAVVGRVDVPLMSVILAAFGWSFACKVFRAQVLSLKERGFVRLAKLSGASGIEIIAKELVPNMLTFLGTWFAFIVSGAMMAEAGLELIGLGPQNTVSLGIILNWSMHFNAFTRGLINWWLPPCIVLITLFVSLFVISMGLDEIGNPRLRKR